MRIITGKYKGRNLLDCKKFKDLRPTTDKNRENLFNLLNSARFLQEIDFDLSKCDLLDVFSGSGSISFEALSRGAKSTTLIDNNFEHLGLSKKNAAILGEEKNCQFLQIDLNKPLFPSQKNYNLIFIDPPYEKNFLESTLQKLVEGNFIRDKALVIIERSTFEELDFEKLQNFGLVLLAEKDYSKTIFSFLHFQTNRQ